MVLFEGVGPPELVVCHQHTFLGAVVVSKLKKDLISVRVATLCAGVFVEGFRPHDHVFEISMHTFS